MTRTNSNPDNVTSFTPARLQSEKFPFMSGRSWVSVEDLDFSGKRHHRKRMTPAKLAGAAHLMMGPHTYLVHLALRVCMDGKEYQDAMGVVEVHRPSGSIIFNSTQTLIAQLPFLVCTSVITGKARFDEIAKLKAIAEETGCNMEQFRKGVMAIVEMEDLLAQTWAAIEAA